MAYRKWLSWIGTCIIPLFTLFLCLQTNMFQENITYVANRLHLHALYQIWSILVGIYFFMMMRIVYQQLLLTQRHFKYLHCLLLFTMISSSFIPYDIIKFPWLSSLHVDLSLYSALSYLLFLMIYLFYLCQRNLYLGKKAIFLLFIGMMFILMCFIFSTKITGFVEFLYMTFLSWYMVYLVHLPL